MATSIQDRQEVSSVRDPRQIRATEQVSKPQQYAHEHPRPSVTVDIALFTFAQNELKILLIARKAPPFAGYWALPGGFVAIGEELEAAAQRELAEETGLRNVKLDQMHTFGAPDRDPRTRVISVAHLALIGQDALAHNPALAADDAADARWWNAYALPQLAFDHADICAIALTRLRSIVGNIETACRLLPAAFTLTQLQLVYECVLDEPLDKRNFRRKVLDTDLLEDTGVKTKGDHRPARLYRLRA